MNPKNTHTQRCQGFTLIELMVATLLGSILVLTTGVMLTQSYRELDHSKTCLQFQRDLSFAIDVMRREIHNAAESNVTLATEQIRIQKTGHVTTFTKVNSDLICDPDNTSTGDEIVLIDGLLQSFTPTIQTNIGVRTTIALQQAGHNTSITTLSGFRNE